MIIHSRFRRSPSVITRSVGDEIVAAVPARDDFHCLSGTALAMWDLLEIPRTLPELAGIASAAYSTEPERIISDIDLLLDDLIAQGLVEEVEETDI